MNPFNYFLQLLCQKAKNPLKIFESKFPQKNKSHWKSLLRIYHNGKRGFWGDWLTFDLIAMISTPSPFIVLFFPQISTFIVQIGFLSLNAHSVLCNVFSHLKFDSSFWMDLLFWRLGYFIMQGQKLLWGKSQIRVV